ncbi:DNA-binding response regulator [Campylobacter sputorum subsp. bubulus]|uniref:DNA-binding response regulator n=1 Tax=Campylobacter sputorum subsp. sputorum TaxID=32024 RepID=A0A381DL53_9BACT|nr:two-component system response regulator [Campylobacter sputorum bv. faecalis CCUG 20703]ASM38067.1 two-component system response regulator [Campylobacter sputorum bv. paraureolyticus LMG 11764]SUX09983.1 DNA-binding response regulator [Campylobacter sputorum subsp. bubulus]SUX11396.1 DNA-binding response regulator [Campylobacter sputorum subsp. sputorum]
MQDNYLQEYDIKILLLEDNYAYRLSIKEYLETLGYEVDEASDGLEACDKIAASSYHLLILDIKVPEISGHEVIKYAKSLNLQTPIMIMTSLTSIEDLSYGYELGCNEYLKKPFELAELKFRVNELMRKYYNKDDKNIIKLANNYEYDTILKVIKFKNQDIVLTNKEISIIEYLLSKIGSFVSIAEIIDEIWEDKNVDSADIRVHISKIRQKTYDDFIVSSRGFGYKINA